MDETILKAVERAIHAMKNNLGDRLTIDDLARSAMFSKFHFSRVFQRVTGVSPGRFLSAMRLAEAKRLLTSTSITVADIGHQVGYNSVGTFSSRFRSSVGVPPITYRRLGGVVPSIPADERPVPSARTATVRGTVHASPLDRPGAVFIGLFGSRVPEGAPVRYTVLYGPGQYILQNVPAGTWYLTAHSVGPGPHSKETRYIGLHEQPITTRFDTAARPIDLHLRPARLVDPPLLLALPDLDSEAAALSIAV
ncbi:MAG TPA: AraC family transcriptional regulator [Pseudonocardiaceae bacterium]|jgi:AraC-like DNA-binding protein|nr:AraC family transcriptional regulator [Pseudonocardiaceae bacterium]